MKMIYNLTQKKVLSTDEIVCPTLLSQTRGLIFRPKQNLMMVLSREKKVSLHNWFVFYPLDVLVADKKGRIVEIKRHFRPFALWNSQKEGKYIIELAFPGRYRYSVGDKLGFRS